MAQVRPINIVDNVPEANQALLIDALGEVVFQIVQPALRDHGVECMLNEVVLMTKAALSYAVPFTVETVHSTSEWLACLQLV